MGKATRRALDALWVARSLLPMVSMWRVELLV